MIEEELANLEYPNEEPSAKEYPCKTLHETENLDVTVDFENSCVYILTKRFHLTIWEDIVDVTPNRSGIVDTTKFIDSSIHISPVRLSIGHLFFFPNWKGEPIDEYDLLKKVEKASIYVTFS